MHCVILTRQIGHYHDARYRGAAAALDQVTVISTANEGGFAQFLAHNTGDYAVERLFPDRASYDAAMRDGSLRPTLEQTLDRLAPDAVAVAGWSNPESMIAIRWGRARGVRLVMMSETMADDAHRSALREAIKRRIVSQCGAALVGGAAQAEYVVRLGIPRRKVHYGYNAVDNAHFAQGSDAARSNDGALRAELGLPAGYILASCRFIAKKNLPALVGAYADAARTAELPDLLILGDGEEREAIEQAAQSNGVAERLQLPGYRGYEVLPAIYGLAELFAHVSTVEQWGLVINEAMASGTPVLVSDRCGAARALVANGISGLVVEPTRAAIAEGLSRFFALDPAARQAMATAASEAVADWGPARFGSGLASAIASASQVRRRGRLLPWDAAILKLLEKHSVEHVA